MSNVTLDEKEKTEYNVEYSSNNYCSVISHSSWLKTPRRLIAREDAIAHSTILKLFNDCTEID